ncbi:MAG: hypothetical protein ACE5G8_08315 [Anaerolineae bacterium]
MLVGLAITALLILAAERLFYRLNHPPPSGAVSPPAPVVQEGSYTQNFFQDDDLLGYIPRPNAQVTSIKKSGDAVIYDVVYSIDEYSRRITPVDAAGPRSKFILFFGGSFVFGEGLNDDATLPFYTARLAPRYRVYNYGLSGYGPQQMLAKLQRGDLPREVPEPDGIAVYVFIDGHVERALGSMFVYNAWGSRMPYYTLDRRGNLIRRGNFQTGRPLTSALYELLGKSEIATYYHLNIPPRLTDRHYAFAARIIAEARDAFVAQYHSDAFYVLIYPDEGDYFEDMLPHFEAADLKILNYDELITLNPDEGLAIAGDGHPTGNAHEIVARRMVADLKIGESTAP